MRALDELEVEESHPSRGAWIETAVSAAVRALCISRTPRGVRGLKPEISAYAEKTWLGRTPRGVRGLKSCAHVNTL